MIAALNVDKLRLDMGEYVLSVQSMAKRRAGRTALGRVDLDVKRGSAVALVGPAGAGKSLTLACIAGACTPTRGRVRYFGYEIKGRGQARIARMGIVRTHQVPQAFGDMTVLETVTVGALLRHPSVTRARESALAVLALTGLEERHDRRFPALDDLDRKRLELARALATEPQLLLLDDLAAGLDAGDAAALGSVLTLVHARGTTIVLATRTLDDRLLSCAGVVEIDRGQTAETGAYAAVNFRA